MRSGEQDVEGNVGEVLSGRVERASQRVNGEGDMEELTEIAKTGVASVQARSQDIDTKITEVISVANQILDTVKEQFTERMERLREEVSGYKKCQVDYWRAASSETQECFIRLQSVQQLVQGLRLGTLDQNVTNENSRKC